MLVQNYDTSPNNQSETDTDYSKQFHNTQPPIQWFKAQGNTLKSVTQKF